jgi:PAS domain S-box-containing protein
MKPESKSREQLVEEISRLQRQLEHLKKSEKKLKLAEQHLQESESRYKSLIEQSPTSIEIFNMEGTMIHANKGWEELWGISTDAVVNKFNVFKDPMIKKMGFLPQIKKAFAGETGEIPEAFYISPDDPGKKRWLHTRFYPVRDASGEVTNVVVLNEDITLRKLAEEEHKQLEDRMHHARKLESLGVLAGGIAREFNDLLTGILGNTGMVKNNLEAGTPAREYVEKIENSAMRAVELCSHLLDYSGKSSLVIQTVDITNAVHEMTNQLEASVSRKAEVKYNLSSGLPAVAVDPVQFRQALMNLIANASDALGEDSGVIAISTGTRSCRGTCADEMPVYNPLPARTYVFVDVADTGCGMDEETKKRIFEPFFTTKHVGRGLGLAAVLGIIRSHNGGIELSSEPGRGTTVSILLPPSKKTVPADVSLSALPGEDFQWSASAAVLVADDEDLVLDLAKETLESIGFHVLTARDGVETVEIFRRYQNEISLILLDMTMPRLNGDETLHWIRSIKKDAKVILSSGYDEFANFKRFGGQGPNAFLRKPYKPSNLIALVRRIMESTDSDTSGQKR